MSDRFTIVAALNVTPDSFYDGGEAESLGAALEKAEIFINQGADIIEVGGESTFVDRDDVSADEELNRVIPVIEAIKQQHPDAKVSIDTYKSQVAQAAIDAGVMMVNDVTAGRGDSEMFNVLATSDVPLVLMHSKDPDSRTTMDDRQYDDVMETIIEFLAAQKQKAVDAGITEDRIILDPGLGFFISSDAKYSYQIIAELDRLQGLGCPIFISPSRKSFLAGPEKLEAKDRLPGTIAASALAVQNGATYIRTHDVEAVRQGCEVAAQMI